MNGRESNAALTAKVTDLEKRLAAVEVWMGRRGYVFRTPDTRVSDAVRARDTLGRRDVTGAPHAGR